MTAANVAWERPEARVRTVNIVFYRLLKSLTILLAALIAPLSYLSKKPTVPAFIGSAIVVLEVIQLVFHFRDDGMPRSPVARPRVPHQGLGEPTWGGGHVHFPKN